MSRLRVVSLLPWLLGSSCASGAPPERPTDPRAEPRAVTASGQATGEPVGIDAVGRAAPEPAARADARAFEPVPGFDGAVRVRGLPPAIRVTALFGGAAVDPGRTAMIAACALASDGTEWCWRYHESHEPDGLPPLPARPMALPWLGSVREISGLYALGDEVRSLLPRDGLDKSAPARALAAAGADCAIRRDGRVSCWYGVEPWDDAPLGDTVPGVRDAIEVAVGAFGGCAVERPGTLTCWGAASLEGWAPGGAGFEPPPPTRAVRLRGPSDVAHVSLSGSFPCLVRRSGRVACWFPEDATTLLPTSPLPPESHVLGVRDAVAVSADLVLHASGDVGVLVHDIDDAGTTHLSTRPFATTALTDVVALDGSSATGCALRRPGDVLCWGVPL